MKQANLSRNRLCDSLRVVSLPEALETLDITKNEFESIAVITRVLEPRVKYDSEFLRAVVDESGRVYRRFNRTATGGLHQDYYPMMSFISKLPFEAKRPFQKQCGQPKPLHLWKGVELNSENRVVGIHFISENGFQSLKGELNFAYIPCFISVIKVYGIHSEVSGKIDAKVLPRALHTLLVGSNRLRGDFKFQKLPMKLRILDISWNCFEGQVALEQLPIHIEILAAGFNRFQGTLDLTSLPRKIRELGLEDCQFTGTVSLNFLPTSLAELRLFANQLQGKLRITRIPASLRALDLHDNNFTGTAVIAREALNKVELKGNSFVAIREVDAVLYS